MPKDWQPSQPARQPSQARRTALLLTILLGLVLAAFFLLLAWWLLVRAPRTIFVGIGSSGDNRQFTPHIPVVAEDFAALRGERFPWGEEGNMAWGSAVQPSVWLAELLDSTVQPTRKDYLIVYVRAHGVPIGQQPYLLRDDLDLATFDRLRNSRGQSADGGAESLGLPVRELLAQLGRMPAKRKLLVLDTGHIAYDARLGITENVFFTQVQDLLAQQPSESALWVLTSSWLKETPGVVWPATAKGSSATQPAATGRSVFGQAFSDAMMEGRATEDDDSLTLAELHAYVQKVCQNFGQTPRLLQAGAASEAAIAAAAAAADVEIATVQRSPSSSDGEAPASDGRGATGAPPTATLPPVQPADPPADATAPAAASSSADAAAATPQAPAADASLAEGAALLLPLPPLPELDLQTASAADLFDRAWQLRDRCERPRDSWAPFEYAPQTWRKLNAYLVELEQRWWAQDHSAAHSADDVAFADGQSKLLRELLSELRGLIAALQLLDADGTGKASDSALRTIGPQLLQFRQRLTLLPPPQLAAQENDRIVQHARDIGQLLYAAKELVVWHGRAGQMQLLNTRSTPGLSRTRVLERLLRTLAELTPQLTQRTLSSSFARQKKQAMADLDWLRQHIVADVVEDVTAAQARGLPLPVSVWKELELLLTTPLPIATERRVLRRALPGMQVMGRWREQPAATAQQRELEWSLARLTAANLPKFTDPREVYQFYRDLAKTAQPPYTALRIMDGRDEPAASTASGPMACLPFDATGQLVLQWLDARAQPLAAQRNLRFGSPQALRLAVRTADGAPLPELTVEFRPSSGLKVDPGTITLSGGSPSAEIPLRLTVIEPPGLRTRTPGWQLQAEVRGAAPTPAQAELSFGSGEILLSAAPDEGYFSHQRATRPMTLQLRPVPGYATPFQLALHDGSVPGRTVSVELFALPSTVTSQVPEGILFRHDTDTNSALQRQLDALEQGRSHDCRLLARLADLPLNAQKPTPLVFPLDSGGDAVSAAAVDVRHGLLLVVRQAGVDGPEGTFLFPIELNPLQPREFLEPAARHGIAYAPDTQQVTAAFVFRRLPPGVLATFAGLLEQRPIDIEWQTRPALPAREMPGFTLTAAAQGKTLATLAKTGARAELDLKNVPMARDEQGRNYAFDVSRYPRAFVLFATNRRTIQSEAEIDQYDKLQFVRINHVRVVTPAEAESGAEPGSTPAQSYHTWIDRQGADRPFFEPRGQRVPELVFPPADQMLVEVQVDGKPDLFERVALVWNDGTPQVRYAPRQTAMDATIDSQGRLVVDCRVQDHQFTVDTRRFRSRGRLQAILYQRELVSADAGDVTPASEDLLQVIISSEELAAPAIMLPATLPWAGKKFSVALDDRSEQVGLDPQEVYLRVEPEAQLARPLDLSAADRAASRGPGQFEISLVAPSKRDEKYWVHCWFQDRLGRGGHTSKPLELRWPDDTTASSGGSPAAVTPGTLQVVVLWGNSRKPGVVLETTIKGQTQTRESNGNGEVRFDDVPPGKYVLKVVGGYGAFSSNRELTGELEVTLAAPGDFFPPRQYSLKLQRN